MPAKSVRQVLRLWSELRQFVSDIVGGSYYIASSIITSCLLAVGHGSFLALGGQWESKTQAYASNPVSRAFGFFLILVCTLTIILTLLEVANVRKQRHSSQQSDLGP